MKNKKMTKKTKPIPPSGIRTVPENYTKNKNKVQTTENKQDEIKKRLSHVIKTSGKSLKAISRETEIPYTTLGGYVQEKKIPRINTMNKLADYFGVTVNFLMGLDEERKSLNLDEIHAQLNSTEWNEEDSLTVQAMSSLLNTIKHIKNHSGSSDQISRFVDTVFRLEKLTETTLQSNELDLFSPYYLGDERRKYREYQNSMGALTVSIQEYVESLKKL